MAESEGGRGFKQRAIDPCTFYHKWIILISWLDNCLIFATNKQNGDYLIENLHKTFMLTEEDNVLVYLEV